MTWHDTLVDPPDVTGLSLTEAAERYRLAVAAHQRADTAKTKAETALARASEDAWRTDHAVHEARAALIAVATRGLP